MDAPGYFRLSLICSAMSLSTWGCARTCGAANSGASVAIYIGTDTAPDKGQGIYLTYLNLMTGELSPPQLAAETVNPTFLALHPSHKFLFAASNVSLPNHPAEGAATAFAIDPSTGKLTMINQQPSGGPGPCHVSIAPDGRHLVLGNYTGGSFAVLPVDADGKLAEPGCVIQDDNSDPARRPHGHCSQFDPTGKFVVGDDLGLDKIFVFRFDPGSGVLTSNAPPAADTVRRAGPRHFAFHPNGKWGYNINELNSTMGAYAWDARRGVLTEMQTLSTLPADFHDKSSCAEVVVDPAGRFLYGSNRGDDSIAVFKIDPESGRLTPAGRAPTGGRTPRSFALDPGGNWLVAANQDSGTVMVFKIDAGTGALTPNGQAVAVKSAVCVMFAPK